MNEISKAAESACEDLKGPKAICVAAIFLGDRAGQLGSRNGLITDCKEYHYFVQPGDAPKVGDTIVTQIVTMECEVPDKRVMKVDSILYSMTTAVITKVFLAPQPKATKPYLFLIPAATLIAREAEQALIGQRFARKAEALKVLKSKLEEQMMLQAFENLAGDNPELQALLTEAKWNPSQGLGELEG